MASCSDAGRASGRIAQFSSVLLAYPSTRDFPLDPGTKALLSQVELLGRVRPYAEMRAAVLVSIRRRVRFMSRLASAWAGPRRSIHGRPAALCRFYSGVRIRPFDQFLSYQPILSRKKKTKRAILSCSLQLFIVRGLPPVVGHTHFGMRLHAR
jgi:hypothetical protein